MANPDKLIESKCRELEAAQMALAVLREKVAGIPVSERDVKLTSDLQEKQSLVERLQKDVADLEGKRDRELKVQTRTNGSDESAGGKTSYEFVNRAYELEKLSKPVRQQFVLLDAPAGYGKTELLSKVADSLRALPDCICIFINFEDSEVIRSSREELIRSMLQQISATIIESLDLPGLINLLAGKLAGPNVRAVELIFDSIDLLAPDSEEEPLRSWLWDELIPSLVERLSSRNIKLHVIFSGRYIQNRFKGSRRHFLSTTQLSPFDPDVVLDLVQQAAKKQCGDYLPSERARTIAKEISDITGGHPKCIVQIVQEIGEINFAVNLDNTSKDYFFSKNQRERMLKQYIEPELRQILRGVDIETQEALLMLSVFRRFNAETIDILINKGYIQWARPARNLLASVMRTHLISDPTSAEPFYTDKVARRMLASKIKTLYASKFYALNKLAVTVYENWGNGLDINGEELPIKPADQHQVIFVIEVLFHMAELMIAEKKNTDDAIRDLDARFHAHLAMLNSTFGEQNVSDVLKRLEDALVSDTDLHDTLSQAVGDKGFELLFEILGTVNSDG